jgi:hypothetical protein
LLLDVYSFRDKTKLKSNKAFGILFFIIFLIITLYPLILNKEEIIIWSLIVSLIFLVLGLLNSGLLTPLKIIWINFGIILGNLISPLIIGLLYFLVIFPTSIYVKSLKRII